MGHPLIIQGGMGVAVSSWGLANKVSNLGQLGVISGTGIDTVMVRRLQVGDPGGAMRRAFDHFPFPEVAKSVWKRYFVEGGKKPDEPFKAKPVPAIEPPKALLDLLVLANFTEVWLAKEGHQGVVGINLLEKIQLPTIPSLYGAMLAGVDYVLIGAGIPRQIPGILDALSEGREAEMVVEVLGAAADTVYRTKFDPARYSSAPLKRPNFLAIVSSSSLAQVLARKSTGQVNGFVVEGDSAGGHNAPPRGELKLDEAGEPIYGPRDIPNLEQIAEIGLPFWLAGSYGRPGKLKEALSLGAAGVQVGTAFAFCRDSGLDPDIRQRVLDRSMQGQARAITSPFASPTDFPFKVVPIEGTMAEPNVYAKRGRICDLGYLRQMYLKEGKIGYRCSAEPIEDFIEKGGKPEDAESRMCLCNGLLSTIGLGQTRKDGSHEPPVITAGRDVATVAMFLKPGQSSYSAEDVIREILACLQSESAIAV